MLIQSIVEHLSSLTLNGSENNSQHQQHQQQYDSLSYVNNSSSSSSSSSSLLNIKGNVTTNGRQQQQCLSNEISTSTCPQPAQSNNNSTIIARPPSVSPSNSSKSLLSSNSCALSSNNNSSCSSWLQFFGGNDNSNSSNQHVNREESEKSMNVTRDWTEYWQSFMNRVENEYQCQDENIEMACEMVRQQVPLVESRIDIFFEEMFRKLEDCKLEMKKSVNNYSEQKLIELTKLKNVKREWNEWLKEEEPVLGLKQVTEKIDELQQVLKNLPNVKQAHEFDLIGMDAEIDWFLDSVRVDGYKESSNDHSILKTDQKFWDQLSRSKFRNLCEQDETYQLQMGLKNIKSNRISRAINWLELSAKQENSIAQYQLGCLYQTGKGVKTDIHTAKSWFEKASNNPDALNDLGCIYSNGLAGEINHKKARELFEKSANLGHALGQKNLGGLYLNGMGVDQDYDKAKEWLEKSACQGNAEAQYYLGCLYYYGFAKEESDTESDSKAIRWFEQSAAQGNEAAKEKLAELLEEIKLE